MESSVQFQELEQYAKQHTRFYAPADSELDFNEQYVQALHERGYTEDDVFFDDYMYQVETARYRAERFIKKRPLTTAIMALRNDIRRKYFQYDEEYDIVHIESLLKAMDGIKDKDGGDILTKEDLLPNIRTVIRVYKEAEKHYRDDKEYDRK